jgi:hypothetical protein
MRPIGGSEVPKTAQPPQPPRRTRATVESLVVYCFSRRLEGETHEASWDLERGDTTVAGDSVVGFPPAVEYGRPEVVGALRPRWPEMAAVLESTRVTSDQIRVVNSAVSAAHRRRADAERDLVLYAAHLWANRILGDIESVVSRAGANRWADNAFLDRMTTGWNPGGGCNSEVGDDEFRLVIPRGEAFLRSHPSSAVAPEVRLLVAEAHETAWSLGKMFPGDEYVSSTVYARDASAHRTRAIALYEDQLKQRPRDSRNAGIRKRLARMRLDVDTGYREFWCSNE